MVAGFGREVDENFAPLGYYAAISGSILQTIRVSLDSRPLQMEPMGYIATSVGNYHYALRNNPEDGISQSLI
jgi:hypothetical protein